MSFLFIILSTIIQFLIFTHRISSSVVEDIWDTSVNFSDAQTVVNTLAGKLEDTFADVSVLYNEKMFDAGLLTATNIDQLVSNLDMSQIRDLVRERMRQSEDAASNVRYAAELLNTPSSAQTYLRDADCNMINETELLDEYTRTLFVSRDGGVPFEVVDEDTEQRYTTSNTINTQLSQVVTPVYIYDCSQETKMDILWTEALQSVFEQNRDDFTKIGHQFLGAATGVLRLFPATNFSMNLPYDQRMQPYYTQSATLPKLVVIALDSSGSVNGDVTSLMQNTLDTIMDLLTDSDMVSVFFFKDDHVYLLPIAEELNQHCGEGGSESATDQQQTWFVPATYKFKQAFKNAVYRHVNFNATADFSISFDEAGKIFDQVGDIEYCTKLVILISDGGKGAATEAGGSLTTLMKANPDMHLIIFLIGPDVFDTKNDDMPVLACAANGFFYRVAHEASIRYTIAQMLMFLSRQLSLGQFRLPSWSSLHIQPWVSDFSPVISVTFPVYSSFGNTDNNEFLGVAGVDFEPLKILKDIGATWSQENGNILLVNNKGTVVFDLTIGQLADIFTANNEVLELPQVSLIEMCTELAENTSQFDTLNQNVILGDDEGQSLTIDADYDNLPGLQYLRAIEEVRYTWQKLEASNNTQDFNLVQRLVVGSGGQDRWRIDGQLGSEVNATDVTEFERIKTNAKKMFELDFDPQIYNESVHNFLGLAFASEIYCPGLNVGTNRFTGAEMQEFLDGVLKHADFPLVPGCMNNPRYWHLIYDLHFLYEYITEEGSWIKNEPAQATFIKFQSGLFAYRTHLDHSSSLGLQSTWETLRNSEASINTATIFSDQTLKAQLRVGFNYGDERDVTAACYRSRNTHWVINPLTYQFPVLVTQPLLSTTNDAQAPLVPFAVAGFIETQVLIETDLKKSFPDCFQENNALWCYFIDDGGFIVFNSQGHKLVEDLQTMFPVGISLYSKDPCLMNQLVRDGIFKQFRTSHETCTCDVDQLLFRSDSSSITHLFHVAMSAFANIINMMHLASLSMIRSSFYDIIQLLFHPKIVETLELGLNNVILCEQTVIKYTFGETQEINENMTICTSTCTCNEVEPYFAKRIANTNLLLVSVRNSFGRLCKSCSVTEKRISARDGTKLFEEYSQDSLSDKDNPVSEFKVNTCNYSPRVQQSQTRGCVETWSQERLLFTVCDFCTAKMISPAFILCMIISSLIGKKSFLNHA